MSQRFCCRESFDKQHGKRAQTLLKSEPEPCYHFHWLLPNQLSWKRSPLLFCKILGLLLNTLATDGKYLVLNRDNLPIPIQIQLSQKQKRFSQFFAAVLKSRLNFEYIQKKMTITAFVFPKLLTLKTWLGKCLKKLLTENLSTSNMVNEPNHCWNLNHSTFIIFIDQSQVNCVGKTFSYWLSKILGLLVNTLAADEKCPVLNTDNLMIPIQMQLSQK